MQSLPRKMNFKMASPIFIWAPLNVGKKEKITPLHLFLPKRRRVKKEDKKDEKTMFTEETISDGPKRSARIIKLNWEWDDEQKQDEAPLRPLEASGQNRIFSRGGRRLRF
jgi:hypothetical protein